MDCTSTSDCWAAGWFYNQQGIAKPMVQHYDGTAWSIVPGPEIGFFGFFYQVTCPGAGDCWAVGMYSDPSGPNQTLAAHFNSTAWSVVSSPNNPNGQNNRFLDVTCASSNDCWAIGEQYSDDSNYMTGEGHPLTLAEHWDGTSWSMVSSPDVDQNNDNLIVSVTCIDGNDCWTVGGAGDATGLYQTLIEHYTVSLPPAVISVVSRKTHGSAGDFDLDLPLTDNPGIECRSGGANGDHQVVITFAVPVTVTDATITPGPGGTASIILAPGHQPPNEVLATLSNVSNGQTLTINLLGVGDGTTTGDVHIPMGVLFGDVNASGNVDAADVGLMQRQNNKPVNNNPGTSNFRMDVNLSGNIDAADVGQVQRQNSQHL